MKVKEMTQHYMQKALFDLKTYWNKPRDGEFLSNKEFLSFCIGGAGINVFAVITGIVTFGAGYFCGSIMGIAVKDFVTINVISTVLGYVFLLMSPINMLIYENHGRLEKREKTIMHVVTLSKIIIGFMLYFIPLPMFNGIIMGFNGILANMLFLGGILDYCNWFVRYKFCSKYGRVKPFIVLYAIPAAVFYSIIPFIPYQGMSYVTKLVILHGLFTVAGNCNGNYSNFMAMIPFMSQNTQERQRIYSFGTIVLYSFYSVINIIFPILITKISWGGFKFNGYEDINVYKVFVPVFAVLSLLLSLFYLQVKEHLIEQKIDRPKVKFFSGARDVLRNKYLWISNLSNILGCVGNLLMGSVVSYYYIYEVRQTWVVGIITGIIGNGTVVANLITPLLTKKFEKRTIYVWGRFISVLFIGGFWFFYRERWMIAYIILSFIGSGMGAIVGGIGNGLGADIMDYHQWKYGSRADSVQGVFTWFTNPIIQLLGYVAPFLYRLCGFTSDWGVLYDSAVRDNLFTLSFIVGIITGVLSIIPYFFYDLTAEKHKHYVQEIKDRAKAADEKLLIEKLKEIGISYLDDGDLVSKLKYEGVDIERIVGEVLGEKSAKAYCMEE